MTTDRGPSEELVWLREHSASRRPSALEPLANTRRWHSGLPRPSGQRHRHSINGHEMDVSGIVRLFDRKRPLSIPWLVVTVVVSAINRMFRGGSRPDVKQEQLERLIPSIADCNAAATVVGITFHSWVEASVLHANPDFVFSGAGLAVRGACGQNRLKAEAATRKFVAIPKGVTGNNDAAGAAVAATLPRDFLAVSPGFGNHRQTTESLTTNETYRSCGNVSLASQTTTRLRVATPQMLLQHRSSLTAVAPALIPTFVARSLRLFSQDRQTTKALSNQRRQAA